MRLATGSGFGLWLTITGSSDTRVGGGELVAQVTPCTCALRRGLRLHGGGCVDGAEDAGGQVLVGDAAAKRLNRLTLRLEAAGGAAAVLGVADRCGEAVVLVGEGVGGAVVHERFGGAAGLDAGGVLVGVAATPGVDPAGALHGQDVETVDDLVQGDGGAAGAEGDRGGLGEGLDSTARHVGGPPDQGSLGVGAPSGTVLLMPTTVGVPALLVNRRWPTVVYMI